MNYSILKKSAARKCINLPELAHSSKEAIAIFHSAHCKAIILTSIPPREII